MKQFFLVLTAIAVWALAGYYSWRLERWFNWKASYGQKMELRVKGLEQRIKKLEEPKHD